MAEEIKTVEQMPNMFWIIHAYQSLIWKRSILAFVPGAGFMVNRDVSEMDEYWYLERDQAEEQAAKLQALNIPAMVEGFMRKPSDEKKGG